MCAAAGPDRRAGRIRDAADVRRRGKRAVRGESVFAMNQPRWFFHPIFLLVLSIVALTACLFLYIYWYVEASAGLAALARRINIDSREFTSARTWVVILTLSILFAVILLGINMIFVYTQKASQLFRMQNNFINNFTHELKTPVTSIKLYLQTFLLHDFPEEERKKYIHFMLKDIDRLSDNITRILNLAKIESQSYKGEYLRIDIIQLVKRFIEHNQHLFLEADIKIHVPENIPIICDINPPLFEMLIMNLLTNAIQYNSSDIPRVDITFTKNKRKAIIRFADNGMGIEKKYRKKIFKKFFQAPHPQTVLSKGSGLGLYLARMIVRQHKGKIQASSEGPGKGTVFTVILRAREPGPGVQETPGRQGDGHASE